MTRKELLKLPIAKFGEEIPLLDELYFIPTMRKHESGYRCIEIIGIRYKRDNDSKGYNRCTDEIDYAKKVSRSSDVIHWNLMLKQNNAGWRIDVPSDCNCMRLFTWNIQPSIKVIHNLSDFEFEVCEKV